jgi:hypothetical protein
LVGVFDIFNSAWMWRLCSPPLPLQVHKMSGSTDMVPLERQLRDLVIQFQKHIARQKGPALLKRW